MLSYVFMGSPEFAREILSALCAQYGAPLLVITQPAKPAGRGQLPKPTAVALWAKEKGLNLIECPDANAPEVLETLRALSPDLLLVAAFGQILKQTLLDLPRRYCLNVHASLLPKYRGAAPVARAILSGDKETGVCIQKMARKLDTGDILVSRSTEIREGETSDGLLTRLAILSSEMMLELLPTIEKGTERLTPQDDSQATYAKKLDKAEARIDWARPATLVLRKIDGLLPWPVAEFELSGDRVRVFRARRSAIAPQKVPAGTAQTDHQSWLRVVCGDGEAIDLLELQAPNRKRMPTADFLRGFRGQFPCERVS